MLVVGSVAFKTHEYLNRPSKDLDIFGRKEDIVEFIEKNYDTQKAEVFEKESKILLKMPTGEIVEADTSDTAIELDELVHAHYTNRTLSSDPLSVITRSRAIGIDCAPLDALYALKMSHRFKKNSPHFLKTMRDIQYMRKFGCEIPEYLKDWYKRREKETYNYGHPSLKVKKNEFFQDQYKYDHDTLHLAVKHLEHPAYWYFKPKDSEVWCDKGMWDALDKRTQLLAVLEESYVLALERSQIPFDFKPEPKKSFNTALMKVCTSITSGWFREFAWENYDSVQAMYSDSYIDKFKHGLSVGVVKKNERYGEQPKALQSES